MFTAVLIFVCVSGVGKAEIIVVDGGGGGDHTTIQAAINAASAGDIIEVRQGDYQENVVIDKQVNLEGTGGGNTVIDGAGSGYTVEIRADGVTLSGFNVTGGGVAKAGIYVTSHDNTISSVNVLDNQQTGILLKDADRNIIEWCIISSNYYGLHLDKANNNVFADCTVSKNTGYAIMGGGHGNLFARNEVTENHFGLSFSGNSNTIENNTFEGETSTSGSALSIAGDRNTISRNICTGNDHTGIAVRGVLNTVSFNTCLNNARFGIMISLSSECDVTNNSFMGNDEGGILVTYAHNNTFRNNICESENGSAFKLNYSPDNTFSDNTCADSLCGFYISRSNRTILENNRMDGCGIFLHGSCEGHYSTHTIDTSNLVNGKPVQYRTGVSGSSGESGTRGTTIGTSAIIPHGAGQVILVNCSNMSIEDHWVENATSGIIIGYSEGILVENVTSNFNSGYGLYVCDTKNITIQYSVFIGNDGNFGGNGIHNTRTNNVSIHHNHIAENIMGIRTHGKYIQITNNSLYRNEEGVNASENCGNISIHSNNIQGNTLFGVYVYRYMIIQNGTLNYWGHTSGPYNDTTNHHGKGDNVTIRLLIDPWLTERVSLRPHAFILSDFTDPILTGEPTLLEGVGFGEGEVLRYVWSCPSSGEILNTTESMAYYTFPSATRSSEELSLKVQDSFGFWSLAKTVIINLHDCPTCAIDTIDPETGFSSTLFTFTGTGTDDNDIELYLWISSLDGELYNGTSTFFTADNLSVGIHEITLTVQDIHGAWSEAATGTLTILPPNEKPTIGFDMPETWKSITGPITITIVASDPDGSIEKVEIKIDDGEWIEIEGTDSWKYQWDTSEFERGDHLITIRSYDGMNYSEEHNITVTLNEKEDDEDGGFIPGLGLIPMLIGLGATAIVMGRKPR